MTLTEEDVTRLEAAGEKHFYRVAPDGSWQLVNLGGRCVFLGRDGTCTVYAQRPEGCQLYPFVLHMASGRVIRDHFCPHRRSFRASPQVYRRVRESVAREEREAQMRRQGRRSG